MKKQHYRLIFGLSILIACCFQLNAQDATNHHSAKASYSEEFVHHARELFNWKAVDKEFQKRLNISAAQSNLFFAYLVKKKTVSMVDYLERVKDGSITEKNATDYWIGKLPEFEKIYQQEKDNFTPKTEPASTEYGAPSATCNNLDFTSGTTNWTGKWCGDKAAGGTEANYDSSPDALPVVGLNSSGTNQANYVHELMTAGNDPYAPISRVPPGHSSSLRLGADEPMTVTLFYPYNHQVISNTFTVSATNPAITYWYAVVFDQSLDDPHPAAIQPFFKIRLKDKDGNEIKCAAYDVNITAGINGGFKIKNINTDVEAVYKDWVPVYIPLIDYIGQQITIQFESSDCRQGGHFGYAYIAVDCNPFEAITTSPYICGVNTVKLTAPAGSNTYVWSGPGVIPPNNTQSVTVDKPGKYTVKMSVVGNGGITCTFDLDTVIGGNANLPIANFSSTVVCAGSTTNFTDMSTPTGSITEWSWDFDNNGTIDSKIPNPTHIYTTPGTYKVKLTIKQGPCEATIIKDVIVETPPLLVITNPAAVCAPNTIDITLAAVTTGSTTGTLSYWTDAAATVPLSNPNAIATAGTYYIKLTPASAPCPAIKPVVVTFNAPPTLVITDPPAVCDPNTVNITDLLVTTGSDPGTLSYWQDANATVPLTTPNAIKVSGTYYIKLTSAAGCISIKPVKVNTNSLPNSLAGPDVIICSGVTTASIGSTPVNGYTYEWSPVSGLTNPNIANPGITTTNNGTTPIKTTYTLTTVVAATGCKATDNVDVIVNPQPVLIITDPAPVCTPSKVDIANPAVTINSTAIGGGTLTYWTNSTATAPLTTPPNAVSASGTYYIKVVVAGGCEDIKPVNVVINPLPVSNAGPDVVICTGDMASLGTSSLPNFTYQWSPQTGLSSGMISNPTVTLTNTGKVPVSSNYVVTTTNTLTGCVSTDTVKVTVNSVPTVNAGSAASVCPGSIVELLGSIGGSATSATWSGGNGTFGNRNDLKTTYKPTQAEYDAGTITLTLTSNDPDGPCTFASSDVILTFYKNPTVYYSVDKKEGCPVHCVSFTDSSVVTGTTDYIERWSWNFGDPGSVPNNTSSLQKPKHCYANTGFYDVTLTVTSNHGCVSTLVTPKMIQVFAIPVAEFYPTPNPASVLDPKVTLVNGSSPDVVSWNYHFGDGDSISPTTHSPTHKYPEVASRFYTATLDVKNKDGCVNSIEHIIEIGPEFTFYIPNAFTPDGDGINDFFFGTGIGIILYDLTIFDRWGNLIFHSEKLMDQWNGKANNGDDIAQQDVFVWKVKLTDVFGKKHSYIGTVTLVK